MVNARPCKNTDQMQMVKYEPLLAQANVKIYHERRWLYKFCIYFEFWLTVNIKHGTNNLRRNYVRICDFIVQNLE